MSIVRALTPNEISAHYRSPERPEPLGRCHGCGGVRRVDTGFLRDLEKPWRNRVLRHHLGRCTACAADAAGWWQEHREPPRRPSSRQDVEELDRQIEFLYGGPTDPYWRLALLHEEHGRPGWVPRAEEDPLWQAAVEETDPIRRLELKAAWEQNTLPGR